MKSAYRKHLITAGPIWAGCFVVLILVYLFLLAPQNKRRRNITKELSEQKQLYERALEKAQEKARVKLGQQIERLENTMNGFVINSEDTANLIFAISQIANAKRVSEFRIGPKKQRLGSKLPNCKYIGEDRIDLSFSSGFNQFVTLLNALERHQPAVFVDGFEITRSDQGKSGHKVDMDLAVFVKRRQDS